MKNYIIVITSLVIVMLISGCGSDDDTNVSMTITELEGKWSQQCIDLMVGTSLKPSVTFSGSTYTALDINYSDSQCITANFTGTASGTFEIGNTITTSSGLSAKNIDFHQLKENGLDVNRNIFSIFQKDNETLYLGDNNSADGKTSANRHIVLDFQNSFTKD